MRRAAKIDAHQRAIVAAFQSVGCDVLSLAAMGKGVPDLLIHRAGRLVLCEVKRPAGPRGGKSRSGQKLNADQAAFAQRWPVYVVETPEGAVRVVGGGR